MTITQIAQAIPSDVRTKILVDWLPKAVVKYSDPYFRLLWEAYFLYVDPDGVQKTDCPICWGNVHKNWLALERHLKKAEQDHRLLETL